jgi:hypothetical protein
MFPPPIFHYFEWIALLCGVVVYAKIKHTPLRWLVFFLCYMVITETLGRYFKIVIKESNNWLYNIYLPVEAFIYSFILYKYAEKKWFKKSCRFFIYLIPIISLVNILFFQGIDTYNTYTNSIFSVGLLTLSIMYFIDVFLSEKLIIPWKEPLFWIVTGLFFYVLVSMAYTFAFDYILINRLDANALLYTLITRYLICTLYLMISIGLLLTFKYEQKLR